MEKLLNFIRGIVRPIVILASIATILTMAIKLTSQFGDAVMARDVLLVVLTLGTAVVSFLFGERRGASVNEGRTPPTPPETNRDNQ